MKRIANYLLTATALLGAAALLTFAAKNDFGLARNMETLVNMMRELSVYYVDEVDADRLMTDAAEGMVRRLDPYTVYMPEEEMTDFQFLTTGKYGGVGALIRKKGDGVVVAQPYKGFPADRAGLQIGDRFVEIAGKDARGMTTEQVSALLKGTPNTNVTIKVEKLLTGQVEEVKRAASGSPFRAWATPASWPTASGISSTATLRRGATRICAPHWRGCRSRGSKRSCSTTATTAAASCRRP